MTCSRVPSCWGTGLDQIPGVPGPCLRQCHDYFMCACLVSSHPCQAPCLGVLSCLLQHLCVAKPRAGGQSLPQPRWVLSVCPVHPSQCWRRCKRSPVSLGLLEEAHFHIKWSEKLAYFIRLCSLFLNWWLTAFLQGCQSSPRGRVALHFTVPFTADRWRKGTALWSHFHDPGYRSFDLEKVLI